MIRRDEGDLPIPGLCEVAQFAALLIVILLAGYMAGQWIRVLAS